MSMFDLFSIVFESDTKGLKKGLDESKKTSDAIQSSLKGVDQLADNAGHGLKHLAVEAAGALTAVFAVGSLIHEMFSVGDKNAQLGLLSKQLKINIQDLGAWGDAAEKFGGSNSDTTASIEGLNKQMQVLALTGTSRVKKVFEGLGVSVRDANGHVKTTMGLMDELSDKFKQIGSEKALGIGERLGLDKSTIMMMSDGKAKLHELIDAEKKLGEPTAEDAAAALEFKHAWMDVEHIGRSLATMLGTVLFPALNLVLDGIIKTFEFIKDHKALIISAITGIGFALIWLKREAILGLISSMAESVIAFALYQGGLLLIGDAAAWAAVKAAAMDIAIMAIPLAIAALIAIIGLCLEDIWKWAHGGKSAIGHLLGSFDDFKAKVFKVVDSIKNYFKEMWETVKKDFHAVMDFLNPFSESGKGNKSAVALGQQQILGASAVGGLNASTSHSIANSSTSSTQNLVTIQKVEVNDNTGNADSISKTIGTSLHSELKNVHNSFATGRAA